MLLDKLRPVCHGLSVCGAGGGGFVACITKRPGDQVNQAKSRMFNLDLIYLRKRWAKDRWSSAEAYYTGIGDRRSRRSRG